MNDFFQMLKEAFPSLKSHPRLILAAFIFLVAVIALYGAKGLRSKVCKPLSSKLYEKIFLTQRWLFVFKPSQTVNEWKYYTSEVTGKGNIGDDIIWTLVRWPSLKPVDRFVMAGAVGMESALQESQVKLEARWHIAHNPDYLGVGFVPARGIRSKLRRAAARVLHVLGSI
jgi:hypothetical protein